VVRALPPTSVDDAYVVAAVRVVVIDSDVISAAGWRALLKEQPWLADCELATSVDDCLAQIEALNPHLAIVNLKLGDPSGLDICKCLHETRPNLRVVVVCESESPPVEAARAVGAKGLVHRGWPLERLMSTIYGVAAGGVALAGRPVKAAAGARLSSREVSVLKLLATGASNAEIAAALHLSRHTVKEYTQVVFRKLGVRNRVEAASSAARLGL
jgi:DNA-binding NarL/FixJ family response regulator